MYFLILVFRCSATTSVAATADVENGIMSNMMSLFRAFFHSLFLLLLGIVQKLFQGSPARFMVDVRKKCLR